MLRVIFLLALVVTTACTEQLNKLNVFSHTSYHNANSSTKIIEGNIFDKKIKSRIKIEQFYHGLWSNTGCVSVENYTNGKWNTCLIDSFPMMFYTCDSLVDINNDGQLELIVSWVHGSAGSFSDDYNYVYAKIGNKMKKLDKICQMAAVSFQPIESTFTTFERNGEYIGKKYFIDRNCNYKLIGEQHLIESTKNNWIKKDYTVRNGQKKLVKQEKANSLDEEYYDFQNWCSQY